MHCQTHTIDQVGMNQAAAAEEVDHFSPFIISVSLLLLGRKEKKRWRDALRVEHHLHEETKSARLTEGYREVDSERNSGNEQTNTNTSGVTVLLLT